ncbi:MAG: glycosyltransferase family 9 protein [Elusimicrobia bacterium]|nr:glycosyltransferase family 9 protein [Elusimicrobiota bacterium]
MKQIDLTNIRKILVVFVAGIGDFVEFLPALKALRNRFPEARLVLLTSSRTCSYASSYPFIDHVFGFDGRLRKLLPLILNLRKQRFDLMINFYDLDNWRGALRMAALFWSIGAMYRMGRDTDGRGFFLNIKIPEDSNEQVKYAVYFNKFVEFFGAQIVDPNPCLQFSEDDRRFVKELLTQNNIHPQDFIIGLNPGSDRFTRRWYNERFAKAADELINKHGGKVVIIGSPKDIKLAEEISGLMLHKPVILAGKTTVSQLAVLISRFNLFITTNSAAMHIAGISGVPLVGLIGPGNSFKDCPQGDERKMALITKNVGCSPCYKWKCSKMVCMKEINVEDVLREAEKLISQG